MPFKKILVGIDGGPMTEQLVELAAKFAKQEKAKLWIVHVLEIPRVLPIDSEILDATIPEEIKQSNEILDKAAEIAENTGIDPNNVKTDHMEAREAGPALVDEARYWGIDLIIIGMNTRHKIGNILNPGGNTINCILKRAQCQVWVVAGALQPAKIPVKGK